MDLFLFTNYFPFKKAEPFLVNEFEFTKKYFDSISILALYGELQDSSFESDEQVHLMKPILSKPSDKRKIFLNGLFNFADFRFHTQDFFDQKVFRSLKKMYWFFTGLLVTRLILSSRSYKDILSSIVSSKEPLLYFYWGDNLCWIIPYLKKDLKEKQVKIIIRLHRTDLYENLKGDYAPMRRQIFSVVDWIVPISKDGKNYLVDKYPAFKDRLFLSRLGVFDHGLNPISTGDVKHIISVSGLVNVKRVHLIFELLQLTRSKIIWHHFGDGPLIQSIRDLINHRRENLDVILHGFVDNIALMDFYRSQSIDLLINASASEGLPVSIMEALSFGIPVIATNVGGTSELVDDNVGKLIESNFDNIVTATEIEWILALDENKKQTLRKNARSYFDEKVNAEINYPQFYEFIVSDFNQ